jgi:hypothetical protein
MTTFGGDVSCGQIAERTNTTFQLSSFYARTQIQAGLQTSLSPTCDETCFCEPGPGDRVAAEEIPAKEKVAKENQWI